MSTESATSTAEFSATTGFVGRQRELTQLVVTLGEAISGQGRLVILAGQPGIGKTRTAQELTTYAQTQGAQVFWGRCYEGEGAPPYWPWVQLLKSYFERSSPENLIADLGLGASDIAELLPELRRVLPDLETSLDLEPEQARFRLFNSVTTLLNNASRRTPLVLVLEDLHCADRSSLLLLQFVSQQMSNFPLLIISTFRDMEADPENVLSDTLAQLSREPIFRRHSLRGLGPEDTSVFIEMTSGIKPNNQLLESVYARTEGNPFFTAEIVRLLQELGELNKPEVSDLAMSTVPPSVLEVIGHRLNRTSDECQQILTLAAVIGREFDFQILDQLCERIPDGKLLEAVDEALEARLIEDASPFRERYQFCHALIQETLLNRLSSSRKVRLHAQIVDTLEGLYGDAKGAHSAELAHHAAEAETVLGPDKVVYYSLMAGERALSTYAWEEALQYFQRGLRSKNAPLEGAVPARDSEEASLLFGLARAQLSILVRGRLDAAISNLDRAFDFYERTGDVCKAVAVAKCPIPRGFRERDKVERRVERGLMLVSEDSVAAAQILPIYGMELGRFENNFDAAAQAFERALLIAQRMGDSSLEMNTLAAWAQVDYFHLYLEDCLEKSTRLVDLAQQANDPRLEIDGHLHALQALIHLGNSGKAEEHAVAGLDQAEHLRLRPWLFSILRCSVNLYRFLGDWRQAECLTSRYLDLEPNEVPVLKELASMKFELGEVEQGEKHLQKMQEVMRRTPQRPGPEYADTSLVSHFAGMITNSTRHFDVAGEATQVILSSPLSHPFWIEIARTGLAFRAIQIGDSALAQEQYLALSESPGKMCGSYLSADRLLGLLARTMGDYQTAIGHFEDAVEFCRAEGWRPELAWTCFDYAETLISHNTGANLDKSCVLLNEALVISSELQMRLLMEKVAGLVEQTLLSKPVSVTTHPHNLTPRQQEVLRLLAQGMTNREIAQTLFLSERTVQRHIAMIYDKIGVRNRSEATVFAMNELDQAD